jgi:hypothetical protein
MNTTTISTAAREYASRPADEKFQTLAAYVAAAAQDRQLSAVRTYNLRDLEVIVTPAENRPGIAPEPKDASLALPSPKETARFTHWSFAQAAPDRRARGASAAAAQLPATA